MQLIAPVTDYIPASILTTQGDLVVRGAAIAERRDRPSCAVPRRTEGGFPIPDHAWTQCEFDDVFVDVNGDWDTVNDEFDVPRDGYYLAWCRLCIPSIAINIPVQTRLRGTTFGVFTISDERSEGRISQSYGCFGGAELVAGERIVFDAYHGDTMGKTAPQEQMRLIILEPIGY